MFTISAGIIFSRHHFNYDIFNVIFMFLHWKMFYVENSQVCHICILFLKFSIVLKTLQYYNEEIFISNKIFLRSGELSLILLILRKIQFLSKFHVVIEFCLNET